VPGGGYVEGMPAQEENLFRRTDCHFSITSHEFNRDNNRYLPKTTDLINARHGRVSLDMKRPRVCVRGPEKVNKDELGYEWLDKEEVFPFYELKAAAVDLRGDREFNENELARRIRAQLDTLIENKQRHVVLSAFGCGAFRNPAVAVARQYRIAIEERLEHFDCITFAIHHPGYGPNNFLPFKKILSAESHNVEVTQEIVPMASSLEEEPDFFTIVSEEKEHSISENNNNETNNDTPRFDEHRSSTGANNNNNHNNDRNSNDGRSSNDCGRNSNDSRSSVDSCQRSSNSSSFTHGSGWAAVRASILGFAMAKKSLKPTTQTNEDAGDKKSLASNAASAPGDHQWYWQTKQGWVAYDEQANALLERSMSQKIVKLSPLYFVDIAQMRQYRNDDKSKWRRVKREPKA